MAKQQNKNPEVERDEKGRLTKGTPNPGGWSKESRAIRQHVASALEAAFTSEEGRDLLVEAILDGVASREPQLIKLACEYRWGKPVQPVELDPASLSDTELRRTVLEMAKALEGEVLQ